MSDFQFEETRFAGLYLISGIVRRDSRGEFFKTYHEDLYVENDLFFNLREEFYSWSHFGVVRGMHFQAPPYDHSKLVSCLAGSILDVVLDLRKSSSTFGQHYTVELNDSVNRVLFVPKGFAHGFMSLHERSLVAYKTDVVYEPSHDKGIHWAKFGFSWPLPISQIIVSERDTHHPGLSQFETPFE